MISTGDVVDTRTETLVRHLPLLLTTYDLAFTFLAGGGITVLNAATGGVLDTFGITDPATLPEMGQVEISDTAPPAPQPGQRFAPSPRNTNCAF